MRIPPLAAAAHNAQSTVFGLSRYEDSARFSPQLEVVNTVASKYSMIADLLAAIGFTIV